MGKVEKVCRLKLTDCEEPLKRMRDELRKHGREFLGRPEIMEFEREHGLTEVPHTAISAPVSVIMPKRNSRKSGSTQSSSSAYRHEGFWKCMDTMRDKGMLEQLWETGQAPWKRWE